MDNNYFNTGYANGGYSSYQYSPITTNVIKVTSLDEAIMQTTRRPSDMIYFNQDRDEFYNVKVDYEGRKTWATFIFSLPNPMENTPVTRADFSALVEKVNALEAKIGGTINAELNGQNTV